jgi:hypothetical protein
MSATTNHTDARYSAGNSAAGNSTGREAASSTQRRKHAAVQPAAQAYAQPTVQPPYHSTNLIQKTQAMLHAPSKRAIILSSIAGVVAVAAITVGLFVLTANRANTATENATLEESAQTNTRAQDSEHTAANEGDTQSSSDNATPGAGNANGSDDASAQLSALKSELEQVVAPYGNAVSVSVVDIRTSATCDINANKQVISASMIKLAVMAAYLQAVDAGTINPQQALPLARMKIVGGTGKIQSERARTYTYDALCRYMIMYSDNTATNVLIDALGVNTVNTRARKLGCTQTTLNRKLMQLNTGVENYTSAADVSRLLCAFYTQTAASAGQCTKAMDFLLQQTDGDGIPQGLSGVQFAHKTGTLSGIRHDGGIVMARSPYTIVVMCELPEGKANALMAQVARKTQQYFSRVH